MSDDNLKYRIEHDTMGEMKVPSDKYWGAQTQRSLENFKIGNDKMPKEIIRSFAVLKSAAAKANFKLGVLDRVRCEVIQTVCNEILEGKLDDNFPLVVYQTGSGTQSNMNVNEVVAGRGNEMAGEMLLHPNDHVNKSQSSNDTFPTAMNISAFLAVEKGVLPEVEKLISSLEVLEEKYSHIIKTGRTHLQDATPITLGQEISGWRAMIEHDRDFLKSAISPLLELALGGTAVGTGLNAPKGFDVLVAEEISHITGEPFVTATNKFHALSSKDGFVFAHGALKALACDLMKIANDVRWLASGPRCGIGELKIPENEPGSSIMPGKVNPTQCEAVTMVAVQVMGHDSTISFASSQGNFQLNVFMPVIAYDFLKSCTLLEDSIRSFRNNCLDGIEPNEEIIDRNLRNSLMLVTALNTHIGYEKAAEIAKLAHKEGITLREAAERTGYLTEEEFDLWVDPSKMI